MRERECVCVREREGADRRMSARGGHRGDFSPPSPRVRVERESLCIGYSAGIRVGIDFGRKVSTIVGMVGRY